MDNKKIGKLIADLRKKQGLTQQDLGDKVGVGFRAVSKWERGLTLPDITIINELSKILGISSDELLSGELNKENKPKDKKKFPTYIKIIALVTMIIIITLVTILIYNNNRTYTYGMICIEDSEYYIDGKVYFNDDNIFIVINKIYFRDPEILNTIITNYEYEINVKGKFIFGYGYIESVSNLDKPISIEEFTKIFNVNYDGRTKISKQEIIKNNLTISFKFLTEDNTEITKEINLQLKEAK